MRIVSILLLRHAVTRGPPVTSLRLQGPTMLKDERTGRESSMKAAGVRSKVLARAADLIENSS